MNRNEVEAPRVGWGGGRLKSFDDKVLRIFGPERKAGRGDWR